MPEWSVSQLEQRTNWLSSPTMWIPPAIVVCLDIQDVVVVWPLSQIVPDGAIIARLKPFHSEAFALEDCH